ncbi:MAG: hypothetical protein N2510_02035, partial [Ignavibacteria bacterium]|nr:hypothetical protein [Ignavibacteria bacterium]
MQILFKNRIVPPSHSNILHRDKLNEKVKEKFNSPIVLISAPAGYGKTTFVTDFLKSQGKKFSWLTIKDDIDSPLLLTEYIAESIKTNNPDFGTELIETIKLIEKDSEKVKDIRSLEKKLISVFIDEILKNSSPEIIIVLDDLHEIYNHTWHEEYLRTLFEEIPEKLRLIITTRELPVFSLSNLKTKNKLSEISSNDIEFTADDLKLLLDRVYSLNLKEDILHDLLNTSGGWITGIHLIIQDYIRNPEVKLSQSHENLFEFFADEIFSELPENLKVFLITTCHLESFDHKTSELISGMKESDSMISYLLKRNIFIRNRKIKDDIGELILVYEYFPLFKTFLIRKSEEILTRENLKELFKKIGYHYLNEGKPDISCDYMLKAESYEEAAEYFRKAYDIFFHSGRFRKLWNLLTRFPQNFLENNPYLLYYRGILNKYYNADYQAAIDDLDKSLKINKDNKELEISSILAKTEILINSSSAGEALGLLNSLANKKTKSDDKAKILYLKGYVYFTKDEFSTALKFLNDALKTSRENNLQQLENDIQQLIGNIYFLNGEFTEAIHYYENVIGRAPGLYKKFVAYGNLSILYSRSAKFSLARDYYLRTIELFDIFKTPIFEIALKQIEYSLYFEAGDYEKAFDLALKLRKLSLSLNSSRNIFLSYVFLADNCYYMNKNDEAGKYIELAYDYLNKENELDEIILKVLSYRISDDESIDEETLLEIYNKLESTGNNYESASLSFLIARNYIKSSPETASHWLTKAVRICIQKAYRALLYRELSQSSDDLFSFSLDETIRKEIISELMSVSEELLEQIWLGEDYLRKVSDNSERFIGIRMKAFGKFTFYLNGVIIDDNVWKRKNRKLVLAYLILQPEQSATKDQICDMFFAKSSSENLDNLFHQLVSDLRKSLQIKDSKGKTDEYIVYRNKMLYLNNSFVYESDIREFDEFVQKSYSSEVSETERINSLEKAADIYAGDAFPGVYEDWFEDIRTEMKSKYIKCLETLSEIMLKNGNYPKTEIYSSKLLKADILN